ncbi:hypothetical protein TTHERM_002653312 (macronuclear) [Tetrahymena thermophila SB210]|uniref:Oxalate/formate antiporter protein n=1 Tax=Tetrahymena thermophila (strain SB210) TaxID=312017 RepID=W7XBT9_TETTS|nr:hypothetical protein TTHERM_002653312 [Tetrahymena thermophila SB210]EWS76830.1 hypothetical protein TTHERM_002653312 [Tetrahymena thermophila SB210]|eukprot:XP_012650635.1 hypothetical protein TTHERM_002653312 [Tetrahymena thermophila SB210]
MFSQFLDLNSMYLSVQSKLIKLLGGEAISTPISQHLTRSYETLQDLTRPYETSRKLQLPQSINFRNLLVEGDEIFFFQLGSGLAKCINLSNLTLDLDDNQIGDEGASGLGSGLAKCINLSNLTLDLPQKQFICFGL